MAIKRLLLPPLLACVLGFTAAAQCHPPSFEKGRDFINPDEGEGLLQIAVRPEDLSLENLICLATTLRAQNPNWKNVVVLIFTSTDAAYNFAAGSELVDCTDCRDKMRQPKLAAQLRAGYFLDIYQHENFLNINPLGYNEPPPLDTRIDLPLRDAHPRCHLELNDRCALTMDWPDYPRKAIQAKASGSVTLQATILPDGELRRAHLLESDVQPQKMKKLLAQAAKKNLSTWRVEPALKKMTVRVTYTYAIEKTSSQWRKIEPGFSSPNHIMVSSVGWK